MLAAELFLEPGDRIEGGLGTQTRQTLGVSRTGSFLRDRRGPCPRARGRPARGLRLAGGVEDRGNRRRNGRDTFEQPLDLRTQPVAGEFARRATSSGTGSERSRANRCSSRLQASAGSSGGGAACGFGGGSSAACGFAGDNLAGSALAAGGAIAVVGVDSGSIAFASVPSAGAGEAGGAVAILSNSRCTCGRSLSQESSRCSRATSSGTGSERSRANRCSSRLHASAGSSGGGAASGCGGGSSAACDFAGGNLAAGGAMAVGGVDGDSIAFAGVPPAGTGDASGAVAMLSNSRCTCGRSLSQESSRCSRATSSGTGSERSRANRCSSRPQAAAGSTAACDFGGWGTLAGSTLAGGAVAIVGAG